MSTVLALLGTEPVNERAKCLAFLDDEDGWRRDMFVWPKYQGNNDYSQEDQIEVGFNILVPFGIVFDLRANAQRLKAGYMYHTVFPVFERILSEISSTASKITEKIESARPVGSYDVSWLSGLFPCVSYIPAYTK